MCKNGHVPICTYREKDGTMKFESYRMEELATTGISYIRPDGTCANGDVPDFALTL